MSRIELPSGAWIDVRDSLMASDRFSVQDAIVLTLSGPDKQEIGAGIQNKMRNALLTQIITAWSYEGILIPSVNPAGADVIGSTMNLDDYNCLSEKVESLLTKVSFNPSPKAASS